MYINRVEPQLSPQTPAKKRGKSLSDSIEKFVIEDPVEISNPVGDDDSHKREQHHAPDHPQDEKAEEKSSESGEKKSIDVRV